MLPLCWPGCVTVAGGWPFSLPGDRSLADRENPIRGGGTLGSCLSLLLMLLLQSTRQGVQSVSWEVG